MVIKINIANKRPTVDGTPIIVCGNSDYTIEFTFDAEWTAAGIKTARFVYFSKGKVKHQDVNFTGNTVAVPIISNTTQVKVGVYAGELRTTTPAVIPCDLSILCGSGEPAIPTPEEDARIMQLLNMAHEAATYSAPPIVESANGSSPVALINSADRPLLGLTIYGKTTQDGDPTPETPAEFIHAGAAGSIGITLRGVLEGSTEQQMSIPTPNGLPGIPVEYDQGNYVDESGQSWLCDEIDLNRGVYVQRLRAVSSQNMNSWSESSAVNANGKVYLRGLSAALPGVGLWTTRTLNAADNALTQMGETEFTLRKNSQGTTTLYVVSGATTADKLTAELMVEESTLLYALATPIETPLSAEVISAYSALCSEEGNTTVTNDGDAEMRVDYIVDTKSYIDYWIAGLQSQIRNN